jgi:hypothetical protein
VCETPCQPACPQACPSACDWKPGFFQKLCNFGRCCD